MNDTNLCGNHDVLIGYVYDECEPAEGESIAAHVAICAACAEEIRSLRDTRAHLGAWTPPGLPLGFQITSVEREAPAHVDGAVGGAVDGARVLRPAAWWSRPLPAWAQVAAAVVIFALGTSVNTVRSSGGSSPASVVAQVPTAAAAPVVETSAADDMRVTRAEFARLEARLRSMENADVQLASRTRPAVDPDELFARVSAIEQRVVENDRRTLRLIGTLSTLAQEAEEQREATRVVNQMQADMQDLSYVVRTAVAPSFAVRTALTNGR